MTGVLALISPIYINGYKQLRAIILLANNGILCSFRPYKIQKFKGAVMNEGASIRIGHYSLGRTIGSGGFAKVKEAIHDLAKVPVAVKIINKAKMKNKNMISKVKREIRILKFINHPNIIKLYEVLDTTTDIFVVMEMANGGELYEYIQNHEISEDEAKHFFRQIIDGVEAAHLNLVAHRDLKPENILLDSNHNVKIADFGLSNLMKDGKFLKTSCGSLNYAAPEILGHRYYEGTSVDVWSCGIILYTMLVGALPFDEEVVSILYKKIEKAEFTIPNTVSPLAQDLLRRMIQPIPTNRIKICDIKIHPWLRKTIPIYSKLPTLGISMSSIQEVDEEVLQQVKGFGMESLSTTADEDRIRRILKGRMDASFVTAYQLIKDDKERKQAELIRSEKKIKDIKLIVEEVANKLQRGQLIDVDDQYMYGRAFSKAPRIVIDKIFEIFREMKIDFSIKNNQYCLLCTYSPYSSFAKNHISKKKNRVGFGLQLYSKGRDIIVDLRLAQGHPLVFMRMTHQLYSKLEILLEE